MTFLFLSKYGRFLRRHSRLGRSAALAALIGIVIALVSCQFAPSIPQIEPTLIGQEASIVPADLTVPANIEYGDSTPTATSIITSTVTPTASATSTASATPTATASPPAPTITVTRTNRPSPTAMPLPTNTLIPPTQTSNSPIVTITIDGNTRYQRFDGFGGSLSAFEYASYKSHDASQPEQVTATDADRAAIARMLYQEIGLTRTRVVLRGFEPSNDNHDPLSLNPSAFDWTRVDADLRWVALARTVGLTTPWISFTLDDSSNDAWRRLPNSNCALNPALVDEEVEWLLAAALHFREMGQELPYLTINNEPDLCSAGSKIEIADYVTIVKKLGARMVAAGLSTRLVIADSWTPQNGLRYMHAVLNDPEAVQYVGALATHAYADGYDDPAMLLGAVASSQSPQAAIQTRNQIRNLASQYSLPIWMTEICYCSRRGYSNYDLVRGRLNHIHDELVIGGVSAFDVMNLFFIERNGVQDELVHVYFAPDGTLNRYEISLYGRLLGHYSRFALPGSVRVEATSSEPRVRVTAFERPDGSLALVIINNNSTAIQAQIQLNNLVQAPAFLSIMVSQQNAVAQSAPDLLVSNGSTSLVIPPMSITSLAGY